jgi:hypothetical protein
MLEIVTTIRIFGPEVDPDEVSGLLGLKPTSGHRRSEPHFGRGGRRYADRAGGLWALDSPLGRDRPLREHLYELRFLLQGKEIALRELRHRGYDLEVFVGVFEINDTDEISLSPAEMRALTELELGICFDLYTRDEPETGQVEGED